MLVTRDENQISGHTAAGQYPSWQEAHAIHECEHHGWAKDRADPHARETCRRHRAAVSAGRPLPGRR